MKKTLICCGCVMMLFSLSAQQKSDVQSAVLKSDRAPREMFVPNSELQNKQIESEAFRLEQQDKIREFLKTNGSYQLFSVRLDESVIRENRYRKEELLNDANGDIEKNLLFSESDDMILLTALNENYVAIFFGEKVSNENGKFIIRNNDYCISCSSTIEFERDYRNDELILRIQDQDEDKKDVFYVFAFKKIGI